MNNIDQIKHFLSQANCEAVAIEYYRDGFPDEGDKFSFTAENIHYCRLDHDDIITKVTPIITELEPIEVGKRVWTEDGEGLIYEEVIGSRPYIVKPFPFEGSTFSEAHTFKKYQRHELLTMEGE